MVAALDSKSSLVRGGGSSPLSGTKSLSFLLNHIFFRDKIVAQNTYVTVL